MKRHARLITVLVVLLGLALAYRAGVFQTFAEPARIKDALVTLGPWGYFVFVLSYAVLQPFGVPGTVFVLAAPLIWPWPVAFAISMVGTMAASVIGFSFARFIARDWLAERVPARFHAYDEALASRGFVTVATLRFVFWMPQVLHTFLGVSKVPFWTHFWGSVVGYFLPLLLTAYFGEKLFVAMRDAPSSLWVAAGLGAIAIASTFWLMRRCSRSSREKRVDVSS